MNLPESDPRAVAVVSAIRSGHIDTLDRLMREDSELAKAKVVDSCGVARSLLHIATDWPGNFPSVARTIGALIAAGGNLNARVKGETPLHWAASSDDVAAIDALLDGGADLEAQGAIFTGGAPMSDAVVFAQWRAAHRLLGRGAKTTCWQAAALGLLDRVQEWCLGQPPPPSNEITNAFWHACRGGQKQTAEYLLTHGADFNWVGYDKRTPLAAAHDSGNAELIAWLRSKGAKLGEELVD
ncbi:MAG: ankyrin repeat domain-containing protein [Acidobacteriota bacterium]